MNIAGSYKHFKGGHYNVLGTARVAGQACRYVLYQQAYAPYDYWIRRYSNFFGLVDDMRSSRFVKVSDLHSAPCPEPTTVYGAETGEAYRLVGIVDGEYVAEK